MEFFISSDPDLWDLSYTKTYLLIFHEVSTSGIYIILLTGKETVMK